MHRYRNNNMLAVLRNYPGFFSCMNEETWKTGDWSSKNGSSRADEKKMRAQFPARCHGFALRFFVIVDFWFLKEFLCKKCDNKSALSGVAVGQKNWSFRFCWQMKGIMHEIVIVMYNADFRLLQVSNQPFGTLSTLS